MKRKNFISRLNYNRKQNRRAGKILRTIAKDKGPLPPALARQCDEYAKEVLGGREYSPWLKVYSAMAGEFKEGWIPDNFYCLKVMPHLKGRYDTLSDFGTLSNSLFRVANRQNIATVVNGLYLDGEMRAMDDAELEACLFADDDRFVFKVDDSYQGKGIHFFSKAGFDLAAMKRLGDGVAERYIEQHELFDAFAPNSVATLRLTTVVLDDGSVEARAGYLRLGVGDDTHVMSASAVRVPLDMATGAFSETGFQANWQATRVHPSSQMRFAGQQVPSFKACVDFVVQLHTRLPFVRVVGWDLTVDRQGNPVFIEWNGGHNTITFSEATTGPCFTGLNWERYR
ncbi:sugar-transfer associated ATP-grasp domain-containing protein [Ferrimonas balearica]|uniref:sugar-transfer associated ATP-grasp domain-containing protein n=1 Tax=Ferrimonas balearica TaxID=44012 RepID=UPI001C995B8F|nr:sugar-transfer associated ATP-grasp domain-containing protein [Ferrimonas balearica]MBY5991708.1 hypothetical protein [Ferrimonas balearica]